MNKKLLKLSPIEKIVVAIGIGILGFFVVSGIVGAIDNQESSAKTRINQATRDIEIGTCEVQPKIGGELGEKCQ